MGAVILGGKKMKIFYEDELIKIVRDDGAINCDIYNKTAKKICIKFAPIIGYYDGEKIHVEDIHIKPHDVYHCRRDYLDGDNQSYQINKKRFKVISDNEPDKWYVNFNNGMGEWITGTLDDAKALADNEAAYTQENISISDENGKIVSVRPWVGCKYDPDEEEDDTNDCIFFGDFGYYASWNDEVSRVIYY